MLSLLLTNPINFDIIRLCFDSDSNVVNIKFIMFQRHKMWETKGIETLLVGVGYYNF